MKKHLSALFFSIILFIGAIFLISALHQIHADDTVTPTDTPSFTYTPQEVDDNTPTVTITFTGLDSDTTYHFSNGIKDQTSDGSGTINITVCGNGDKNLKTGDGDNHVCDTNNDYFHAGSTYTAAIYQDKNEPLATAQFYVNHHKATLSVSPGSGQLTATLNTTILAAGGKGGRRNEYAVLLKNKNTQSSDYKGETQCVAYPGAPDTLLKKTDTVIFPSPDGNTKNTSLPEGSYTLILQDVSLTANGGDNIGCAGGGFKYFSEDIDVNAQGAITASNPKTDPDGVDAKAVEDIVPPALPPCPPEAYNSDTGQCSFVHTGFGFDINTDPAGFVESIFGFLLGISGGIALLLIIYSGYQMVMSRGKPETLQAARDRLTSAIVGLLFLIFSLAILQIIGVNILHIPGFDSSVATNGGATKPSNPNLPQTQQNR